MANDETHLAAETDGRVFNYEVKICDDNGQDVEVDVMEFIQHVDKFHSIGVSTHMEQKYVFTINDRHISMLSIYKYLRFFSFNIID